MNFLIYLLQPKVSKYDQCHKKKYYDLKSIQKKLGLTQEDVDNAWERRWREKPVYLTTIGETNHFISTYKA